jgi:four helix bundle protein
LRNRCLRRVAESAPFERAFLEIALNTDGSAFAFRAAMANDNPKSPERIRTEKLQERTFLFAERILNLCPRRYSDDPSRTMWRQLIRAAPSASGNLDEADEASSDDDFVYRMKVVLRETKESRRWLRFISRCRLQHHDRLGNLVDESRQLAAIFATIVKNVERRLEAERAEKHRLRDKRSKSTTDN